MNARKIISFLFLIIITQSVFSQSGWFWQNPLPQGNNLYNIQMFGANTGFSCNWDNIVKTTDGGETWTILYTGFPTYNSSMYMVDSSNGYVTLDSTKLIKTTNGGNSWVFVSNLTGVRIYPWVIPFLYFTSVNNGFIISLIDTYNTEGFRLQRTTNGGLNWSSQIADTSFKLYAMDFPSSTTGYISGGKSLNYGNYYHLIIFKTTNSGLTWDSIPNLINMDARSIEFINETTGFVGGTLMNVGGRLLKTTDGGNSWVLNSFNFNSVNNVYFLNENVGYVLSSGYSIYKTTNGGVNWVFIDIYPITGQNYLQCVSFADANTGLGIGTGGLILKTTSGGVNWIKKSWGTDNLMYDIKFSDANTGFATGDYGTLLKTTNGGVNWTLTQFSHWDDIGPVAPVNSNLWYAASSPDGKIFKTTNTGLSWDTLYTGLYAISRLEFLNQNIGMGVCKYNSFFKTTNGGLNWLIYNNLIYSQNWVMDFVDENTGYAGDKIAKTTNGGLNWDTISFGMDFWATDVQFLNYNTGFISGLTNIYGEYTGYVVKTTNGGINWIPKVVSTGIPIEDLYFVNERTGYCIGWGGTYRTTDGSQNWHQIKTCFERSTGVLFFTDSLTGYITGGYGAIIKTTNGGGEPIGIQPISNEIPSQFTLYQNYPNPFNPVTKIKFSVPPSKGVRGMIICLIIYDLLGREVATLINEQLSPGTYEAEWDAADFASGVYFYQLSINNELFATKKMVLIK